ncbi:Protein required for the initiation of cell division [uncultured Roseburia sp.]|uniref:Cell division protein FtsL n=1 Tax=Brotonthovivens ammoniilytica TaxID=2981725 RepID=A0ABT2TFF2_9FIRM|nr:hypothetical protein [Brotonthovivens ammoniilytica]MCU6760923.1 hypothetical protein [Brotonthovivens ammoniilytica]SCI13538.1 Protein required for the initiation of cell division [uncultured Roseburia sp.]
MGDYNRRTSNKRVSDRYTYIQGNTVRKLETAPKRVPVRTREEELRLREKQRSAKRNRQNALLMNKGYVIFLTAATIVCAMVCGMYIHMQASMTINMKQVSSLETQISELKTDNDAAEKRLDTTMNLDQVKDKAQSDLGMSYPASGQIKYYSVDSSDYMNQYGSIPGK